MTSQEKIWKMFRGLNEFTVEEVQVLTGANANTVICFIHLLSKAGYLREIGRRKSVKGWSQKVWKLIKNTGPKCPVQRRCLYDPNLERLMEVANVD